MKYKTAAIGLHRFFSIFGSTFKKITFCWYLVFIPLGQIHAEGYQTAIGTVLDERHMRAVLHQCSRDAPENVSGSWMPEKSQIDQLEANMLSALTKADLKRITDHFAEYRFQYLGLLLGSRRIIYVNAILSLQSKGDSISSYSIGAPSSLCTEPHDWRNCPVVGCDGGRAFWGIEYDPDSQWFDYFSSNGPDFVRPANTPLN